jgi:uncharacterized Fe-S radical SAM superfamily protein PflX
MSSLPLYRDLLTSGILKKRVAEMNKKLARCDLCPRKCFVNRLGGELGTCGIGQQAWVSSYGPHLGRKGLCLPFVYNTGGYDSIDTLELLDGIIDIYMPDMKYSSENQGDRLSGVPDYPSVNKKAVCEMHRQVGDLQIDFRGIAVRGLLIRHLVLPAGLAGSRNVLDFVAREISKNTYLNIMDQYRPAYQAHMVPEINSLVNREEYEAVIVSAAELGLRRLDNRIV